MNTFGSNKAIERIYNVVRVKIKNREKPCLNIEVEVLETDQITAVDISPPDFNFSEIKQLNGL